MSSRGMALLAVTLLMVVALYAGCRPPGHPPHTPQPVPEVPR